MKKYEAVLILNPNLSSKVEDFKDHLSIPVINGLSPSSHPTQVLSYVFTVALIYYMMCAYAAMGMWVVYCYDVL